VRISFLVLQKINLPAYPVHGNGDPVVADSAVVARTVSSAANTEKQRGATMLLRFEQDKYEGIRGIEARARGRCYPREEGREGAGAGQAYQYAELWCL
jgi:hypothetical protein